MTRLAAKRKGDFTRHAAGFQTASDDKYEIQAQEFGRPLRNRMELVPDEELVVVTQL